jgi:hypothetical protein
LVLRGDTRKSMEVQHNVNALGLEHAKTLLEIFHPAPRLYYFVRGWIKIELRLLT